MPLVSPHSSGARESSSASPSNDVPHPQPDTQQLPGMLPRGLWEQLFLGLSGGEIKNVWVQSQFLLVVGKPLVFSSSSTPVEIFQLFTGEQCR